MTLIIVFLSLPENRFNCLLFFENPTSFILYQWYLYVPLKTYTKKNVPNANVLRLIYNNLIGK